MLQFYAIPTVRTHKFPFSQLNQRINLQLKKLNGLYDSLVSWDCNWRDACYTELYTEQGGSYFPSCDAMLANIDDIDFDMMVYSR